LAPDQLARLQDLCKTHQCWLIEDDTMRAFCSEPFPSLSALDGLNRSIYMGDLSLGIAPCLQLGFMAFPPTLLENPGVLDSLGVLLPSEVEVELAYLFVKDREYKRHLGHVRHELRLSNLRAQAWIQQRGLHALVKDTRGPYLSVAWPQTGDFALDTPPGLELVNGATFELESQNAQNWFRLSITPFSST
jgi:DNA-binding transcriptional MocR family regulator